MAYEDELRPASFRNLPFEAFTATDGGGRRGKVSQFPKADDAQFNDRGKKTKPFVLNASVFGENALAQADALEDALNTEGPGRLMHPTRGEMQATCTDYTRKSVSDAGRRVNFTLEFFKEPEKTTGVVVSQNPEKTADAQETQTYLVSATNFENNFKISGQPSFIFQEAKNDFLKMTEVINAFLGDTNKAVNDYINNLDASINEPFKLIQNTQDLIAATVRAASFSNVGIRQRVSASSNSFANARALQTFSTGYENIALTTSTRMVQQENAKAIQFAVRLSATVVESELHRGDEGETLFASRTTAQQALKTLLKQMLLRRNETTELSNQISKMMAATATASSAKYGILADQKTITIAIDTNSLLLAYELYDNIEREEEIRLKNNLTDSFIKKGSILTVSEK